MRYYGFANFMLSSIQQGVQNFHVLGDMMMKYSSHRIDYPNEWGVLCSWATSHKTAIFLNGGNAGGLRAVYAKLEVMANALHLPFDMFHEDSDSLDSTMTACGIIVPEYIVDVCPLVRFAPNDWTEYDEKWSNRTLTTAELELAVFLNQFQLAR